VNLFETQTSSEESVVARHLGCLNIEYALAILEVDYRKMRWVKYKDYQSADRERWQG